MNYKPFIFKSIFGDIHCIFKDRFLIKVSFEKGKEKLDNISDEIHFTKIVCDSDTSDKVFLSMLDELLLYFSGKLREFKQPYRLTCGSPFERRVWLSLQEIPFGQTRTYKWLAEKIQKPMSYRAVGQALGKNPLPLILPCHRIIASDGSIGGFSCGISIKRLLLGHESRHILKGNAKRS